MFIANKLSVRSSSQDKFLHMSRNLNKISEDQIVSEFVIIFTLWTDFPIIFFSFVCLASEACDCSHQNIEQFLLEKT